MVIGHESAGRIDKVGPDVTSLKEGDNVAIEPGVPCRSCSYCLRGRYNLCPDMKFFATPPVDGSLALYINHPADFCFKLPPTLSLDEGAFCEPLSVGVHACNRAGVSFGKTVLVLGCGPIGLVTILVAKAYGASRIGTHFTAYMNFEQFLSDVLTMCLVAVDVLSHRLDMALQCGATRVLSLRKEPLQDAQQPEVKSVDETLSELTSIFSSFEDIPNSSFGPEVTIDCTGFESSLQTALQATAAGGRVCVVGMAQDIASLPLIAAAAKEVDIVGIFRYANTYPTCIQLMSSGAVDVKPLITHR
jgi:L-iditol 2-dehydrogenase